MFSLFKNTLLEKRKSNWTVVRQAVSWFQLWPVPSLFHDKLSRQKAWSCFRTVDMRSKEVWIHAKESSHAP